MLPEREIQEIREELESCKRPLYFFHDDCDGLCSFLLLYRYLREGYGVVVKAVPRIDFKFLKKVKEYQPDKIFILDLALVEQDFIDGAGGPIIWIDHHGILERRGVKYFNPRKVDAVNYEPVTHICYRVARQDIWLGMVGCIADWFMPDFKEEFCKRYPGLLDKKVEDVEGALFNSRLGRLIRILDFSLKGKISEVKKCFKILTRITSPEEILDGLTPAGKFILKRFEKINKEYEKLLKMALKKKSRDKILFFKYKEDQMSFTGNLAGDLIHRFPKKIVITARERRGEVKGSVRSRTIKLPELIDKALAGVNGYGGGHDFACGVVVKVEDWDLFMENFKRELS